MVGSAKLIFWRSELTTTATKFEITDAAGNAATCSIAPQARLAAAESLAFVEALTTFVEVQFVVAEFLHGASISTRHGQDECRLSTAGGG